MKISMLATLAALALAAPSVGQTVAPFYDTFYKIENLGSAPGVPLTYGGVCFLEGDSNTLLLGGGADSVEGVIFAVPLVRDGQGHITGFAGPATFVATAPGLGNGGIDGSLIYFPGSVLSYCSFPDNSLGQILPGSTAPDKLIDLTKLGVTDSVGGHLIVPDGFPGAGRLKIVSNYPGQWYDAALVPDGQGMFDVVDVQFITDMGGANEAILYVDGSNPGFFDVGAILVSKWGAGRVDSYLIDDNGDALVGTELPFINNLYGAEGMAFDPVTNDLVISTFDFLPYGGNEVFVVTGFNPPTTPCPIGDLDGDCLVNGTDLGILLLNFGTNGQGDIDSSGLVDGADLGLLLLNWTG